MACEHSFDVLIVGAGLAGATAASDLAKRGFTIAVIEAATRVGGRAYAREFDGRGPLLEFGGSWITPWHRRIRERVAKHGLALRPRHPVAERRWYHDGFLDREGPTHARERAAHERIIARVAADSMLWRAGWEVDEQGRSLTAVSFADYLDRLQAPRATRELYMAWWCVSGNGDPSKIPAAEFLSTCAHCEGSADSYIDSWAESVTPSMAALVQRMLADSKTAIFLDTQVTEANHGRCSVKLRSRDGRDFAGSACIFATGLNPLSNILFRPALSSSKAVAVERGHEGRALKLWAEVRGVPPGVLATGGEAGIRIVFSERETERGTTLLVGFGLADDPFDPRDRNQVAAAIARFFPEAELVAHDSHDWISDPLSRGTWFATPLDAAAGVDVANWDIHGRLAFASSDIAPEEAGWFEGAVTSGERTAAAVAQLLARD